MRWRLFLNPNGIPAQSPAVAESARLPWARPGQIPSTPTGLRHIAQVIRCNPVGVENDSIPFSQGSSCLATLAGLGDGIPLGFANQRDRVVGKAKDQRAVTFGTVAYRPRPAPLLFPVWGAGDRVR